MSTSPSQYSSGQPAVPPRRSGMTTAGKVLFFVGLALSVIAVIVGIWGINRAIQDFSAMEADAFPVEGTATVPMQDGDVRFILAEPGTDPACTVTGPDGADVPVVAETALDDAAAQEGTSLVGTFTAGAAGEHTVTCESAAELSPALGFRDAIGLGTAGLAFLALFPLGFITLLGLVLWLVGRSRDRKAAAGPGGYGYSTSSGYGDASYGQGYGQQGYGAPGPGQQGGLNDGQQGYAAPGQGYGEQGGSGQGYGERYGSPPPPASSSDSPWAAPPPPGSDRREGGDDDRR
ncbi:hypothetical protein [Ornithinimicrobium pekingense]|nr:hypothetical protein [Ornithinimicrobium pekingense]